MCIRDSSIQHQADARHTKGHHGLPGLPAQPLAFHRQHSHQYQHTIDGHRRNQIFDDIGNRFSAHKPFDPVQGKGHDQQMCIRDRRKSAFSEKNGYTWEVEVSDEIKAAIQAKGAEASLNPMTEEEAAALDGTYGNRGDLELIDFRGRDFDEVEAEGGWDALIDQMDATELESIVRNGGYQTLASSNVGKPRAIDYDGPSGLNEGGITHEPYSITYPCATNLAASWDRNNSYLHGYYVGEDALAEMCIRDR